MALANYSLPYHSALPSAFIQTNPAPSVDTNHGLLYNPADHQQDTSDPSKYNNNPYSAPTQRRTKQRKRSGNAYLPPPNTFTRYPQENNPEGNVQYSEGQTPYSEPRLHTSRVDQNYPQEQASDANNAYPPRESNVDYSNTGEYVHDPSGDYDRGTSFVRRPVTPFRSENSNYNTRRYLPGPFNPPATQPSTPAPEPVFAQQFNPQVNVDQADYNKPGHNLNYAPNNFVGHEQLPNVKQVINQNPSNPHLPFGDSSNIPIGHGTGQVDNENTQPSPISAPTKTSGSTGAASSGPATNQEYPARPAGFVKVDTRQSSGSGQPGKTQLHAILDYDDDDYYEEDIDDPNVSVVKQSVTPLQGPILIRNGSVPVVPLYAYDAVRTPNGTLLQIPILWTALSLALGVEVRGQVVRGVPCVKRHYQLFCPTAGNTYPIDRIEHFIDENKALMKRMYGAFGDGSGTGGGGTGGRRKRGLDPVEGLDPTLDTPPGGVDPTPHIPPGGLDPTPGSGDSYFRRARQADGFSRPRADPPLDAANPNNGSGKVDACESKTEIITPYWALNSARKLRAVVNTMHFEQAVHQEVCSKGQTARCAGECACEQKYKWHRLLAYDPDEDCSGIFMDWFLFPSCCVCRCNP